MKTRYVLEVVVVDKVVVSAQQRAFNADGTERITLAEKRQNPLVDLVVLCRFHRAMMSESKTRWLQLIFERAAVGAKTAEQFSQIIAEELQQVPRLEGDPMDLPDMPILTEGEFQALKMAMKGGME